MSTDARFQSGTAQAAQRRVKAVTLRSTTAGMRRFPARDWMPLTPLPIRGSASWAKDGSTVTRRRCGRSGCAHSGLTRPFECEVVRVLRSNASPAGFSTILRPRRSKRLKPSCSSSTRICWLTALWVRWSTSAAARKFWSSATVRNAGSVCRGSRAILVSITDQYGQNKSIPNRAVGY